METGCEGARESCALAGFLATTEQRKHVSAIANPALDECFTLWRTLSSSGCPMRLPTGLSAAVAAFHRSRRSHHWRVSPPRLLIAFQVRPSARLHRRQQRDALAFPASAGQSPEPPHPCAHPLGSIPT